MIVKRAIAQWKSFGVLSGILSLLLCGILAGIAPGASFAETRDAMVKSDYAAGVQAYRARRYDEAAALFRQVLAGDARNVNAHYYLALTLDYQGRSAEAAAEYRTVLRDGREAAIVAYSRSRLIALQPEAPVPHENIAAARTQSPAPIGHAANNGVALVASAPQTLPVVYKGSVTRVAVPLKNSRNALMVDAMLTNNETQAIGTFIIDTGATYTSISQEMAEQLGIDLSNCETVRITTANGRIDVPKVTIHTLNVNGLEAHNVEATVLPGHRSASFSGLIGLSFIRQFILTIDPQAGQLIFQRN